MRVPYLNQPTNDKTPGNKKANHSVDVKESTNQSASKADEPANLFSRVVKRKPISNDSNTDKSFYKIDTPELFFLLK